MMTDPRPDADSTGYTRASHFSPPLADPPVAPAVAYRRRQFERWAAAIRFVGAASFYACAGIVIAMLVGMLAKRGHGWDVNPWVWALTFERAA